MLFSMRRKTEPHSATSRSIVCPDKVISIRGQILALGHDVAECLITEIFSFHVKQATIISCIQIPWPVRGAWSRAPCTLAGAGCLAEGCQYPWHPPGAATGSPENISEYIS